MPIPMRALSVAESFLDKISKDMNLSLTEIHLVQKYGEICFSDGQANMREVIESELMGKK